MNTRTRIQLTDTPRDIVMKMCDGNPGAIQAMMELFTKAPQIDSDAAMGGVMPLLMLDSHAIYGPRIWMLYKDVCNFEVATVLALLRAVQLGILSDAKLQHAIDNHGDGIDIPATIELVKAKLPNFNHANA